MTSWHTIIALAFALTACGYLTKHEPKDSESDRKGELEARHAKNLETLRSHGSEDAGWLAPMGCDSALFNGLALAAGHSVTLIIAEYESGQWHRRPPPSCWDGEDKGSRSTISNDMLLGIIWGLWRSENLAALERLYSYGSSHSWRMGQPYPGMASRVVMSHNMRSLLARAIRALGGEEHDEASATPVYEDPLDQLALFEEHLQVLGITLYGEIEGEISGAMKERLRKLAEKHPKDRLFAAAYGTYTDMDEAIRLLRGEGPYPHYVRGDDIEAYKLIHWLFAAKLVLRRLK